MPRPVAVPEERTAEERDVLALERATPVRPVVLERVARLFERVLEPVPPRRVTAPLLRETRDTLPRLPVAVRDTWLRVLCPMSR